jgi:hypothetical protein
LVRKPIVNLPAQPAAHVWDVDMTNVPLYAQPGALVSAGRVGYGDAAFQGVSAAGGTVLVYVDPIIFNAFGTYHALLFNSSVYGAAVPLWPGKVQANSSGFLADFRVGGVLLSKLENVLEQMATDIPHMGGFFADDVGSRSWFPNLDWTADFTAAERQDYRDGAIAVCQVFRQVCERHRLIFIVNGTWGGGTLASDGGGYPVIGTHGCALADGGFVEHHLASELTYWSAYANPASSQWAQLSGVTGRKPFMYANTTTDTDRDAFIGTGLYSFVVTQTTSNYELAPVPWGSFHYSGLPTHVTP